MQPPPPYCSERPFQSVGRLTSNLIGGAAGSLGSICPSTLQKAGLAGTTRAAGEPALSAIESADGDCMAAESIFMPFCAEPARPLQAAAASPTRPSANAGDANSATIKPAPHARGAFIHIAISLASPCNPKTRTKVSHL